MAANMWARVGAFIAETQQRLNGDPLAAQLAKLIYHAATQSSLADVEPAQLAEHARHALAVLAQRDVGRHKIRTRQVQNQATTILEIVNDDMPFLVDSVMGEIQARGIGVRLVAHPVLKVRRDPTGRLTDIAGHNDPLAGGGMPESLIIVHLDSLSDGKAQDLVSALDAILAEVRIAVADWRAMLARVSQIVDDLANPTIALDSGVRAETVAFLKWLVDGHFTFLGARNYQWAEGDANTLLPVVGSDLGVLRNRTLEALPLARVTKAGVAVAVDGRGTDPLVVAKAAFMSRVHRRATMDAIAVTTYDHTGRPVGELRIVGLLTSQAYTQLPAQIPLLRRKVDGVVAQSGFSPASHDAKTLAMVLDTFPRDELLQIDEATLRAWSGEIMELDLRPRVRVFARPDRFGRTVSILLYAPRERWSTDVRTRIARLIEESYRGRIIAFTPYFTEGPLVRAHFVLARSDGDPIDADAAALEGQISAIIKTWADTLAERVGVLGERAPAVLLQFADAFPAGYTETFSAARAVADIERIGRLGPQLPVAIDFYRDPDAPPHRIRAAIYRFGDAIRLSDRVPLLENLGFVVIDERSYRLAPRFAEGVRTVTLHDMVLETDDGRALDLDQHDSRLEDAFVSVFHGRTENDTFNRLVIGAGIDWRQAQLMRAYAGFLRQLSVPFGLRYMADTLNRHATIARDLVELFDIRFDPDRPAQSVASREAAETVVRARITDALAKIDSLDEDRILRHLLGLVTATVRTNYWCVDSAGRPLDTLALKFRSRDVEAIPKPRPYREIWVYSPRVEGVHLRFAPIARGGIRWSDRAQDFRTEVLGLVKAQTVKNAVIVPSGAKGGFLPKQLPRSGTRDDVMKEGIAAYRLFIGALLDVTDNIKGGVITPPSRVIRHDGDDPYLVVAADKGTATFSDFANAISAERGHWLGDAFASGGSAGYDHKKMAITARGAWECVKRHFRELGVDIQTQAFRAAGVGDMSGDVFGNGMLLSPVTKLVAAFDHRDIFIDPDPDPAHSFAERKRLFELQRSSWADYDRSKISAGGGIFPRSAKSIKPTPQMAQLLGLTEQDVTPLEVIRAILKCNVDLLWFGGIGTYVRASSEADADVGDRANDAVRVAGNELRAKVVGEGANLALTQRGRVEYAQTGGRLNTDFIDNSAGVNSSDQEVNIKIALGPVLQSGRLDLAARNGVLATMTNDVAAACLRNNYQQALALSLAEKRSLADTGFLARLMRDLERRGLLDRKIELLPSDSALRERQKANRPLTRPELAVLLSYSKIALTEDLLASKVPDEPRLEQWLIDYFPPRMRAEFSADIKAHRLRREIIATALTNAFVNRGGPSLAVRLADETGRSTADAAKAYLAVRYIFSPPEIAARIDALDGRIDGAVQISMHLAVQDLVQKQTLWFLKNGKALDDLEGTIQRHAAGIAALEGVLDTLLSPERRTQLDRSATELAGKGVPADLARDIARLELIALAPEITEIAAETGARTIDAARAFYGVGDAFGLADLTAAMRDLGPSDYDDRLALAQSAAQILTAQHSFTRAFLKADAHAADAAKWVDGLGGRVSRARDALRTITTDGAVTVSRMVVASGQLRNLADELKLDPPSADATRA